MASYRMSFLNLLKTACSSIVNAQLEAVIQFLQNDAERQHCIDKLNEAQFASNDLFTFRVGDAMLDELPELRAYWAHRVAAASEERGVGQCLLCGQHKPLVDKHDSVKLPGAVTSGVALVSFNSDAFEKHGLARNENAPFCRDCMVAYVNALRRCLEARYPRPDGDGAFPQQSIRLSDDTVAVYWDDQSSDVSQALWALNSEDPSTVKALLESAWKGLRPAAPTARFYCLLLTGAQGRASVRGMHTTTVGEVAQNLCGKPGKPGYFTCLEASGYTERPAPISLLIESLALPRKDRKVKLPPGIAGEVFLAAVLDRPLSEAILNCAVTRTRAERKVPAPRAAFLHLYFQRNRKIEMRDTPMALDRDFLDPAYRYGRLLAVLESLQINYHNNRKPNSTIVDRFYAAASTRPATAFPRLMSLAQNHLKTAPYASFFRNLIEEIVSGLDGAQGFRRTLSIEEQGRFALGYFHQRSARPRGTISQTTENEATETVNEEIEQ